MTSKLADWIDLEHKLWRQLKEAGLTDKKILVGFSGGVDSLALLWALHRVKKKNLVACYVHHGISANPETIHYRDQAASFCKEFCRVHSIAYEIRQSSISAPDLELKSEEELREFRHRTLQNVLVETGCELLALAHHRDDLLETRLLRLIRGTGPHGLRAMEFQGGNLLRPFLHSSKAQLQAYLSHCSLVAFEDPSNQSADPFRNWIRQEWLLALDTRQPGAVQSLARSLEVLTEALSLSVYGEGDGDGEAELGRAFIDANTLSRLGLLSLSKGQQKQALARFAYSQNKRDFTLAHIEEVLKRLDNSQKELMFRVGGVDWYVNAQQIQMR